MRVEPAILNHPKYLALVAILGEQALHYLVSVWAHCQEQQRGEFWAGKDGAWLEMVARWKGQPGQLYEALRDCAGPGRTGFVSQEEGGLRIHQWEEFNSVTVGNWTRNRAGRKNPTDTPRDTRRPPAGVSALRGSSGGSNGHQTQATLERLREAPKDLTPPTDTPTATPTATRPSSPVLSSPSLQEGDDDVAKAFVGLLNELTGAQFELPIVQLEQVTRCYLETGRDRPGIEQMVRRQVALWSGETRTRQWLKPLTLFGEHFHEYYGQRALPARVLTKAELEDRILKNPANRQSTYHSNGASAADKARLAADKKALEQIAS